MGDNTEIGGMGFILAELIQSVPADFDWPDGHLRKLQDLLIRMSMVRSLYARPMAVTSGYRTMDKHINIYKKKAFDVGITFSMNQVPLGSKHLLGRAVDIRDIDGALYRFLKNNESVLIRSGLWCEEGTSGWVHFQSVPPKSNKRWFLP